MQNFTLNYKNATGQPIIMREVAFFCLPISLVTTLHYLQWKHVQETKLAFK
jgi:hypothetical protein